MRDVMPGSSEEQETRHSDHSRPADAAYGTVCLPHIHGDLTHPSELAARADRGMSVNMSRGAVLPPAVADIVR